MKKPALYLTVLFLAMILSTALVSTIISGFLKSLHKENTESVKAAPATEDQKLASVKL